MVGVKFKEYRRQTRHQQIKLNKGVPPLNGLNSYPAAAFMRAIKLIKVKQICHFMYMIFDDRILMGGLQLRSRSIRGVFNMFASLSKLIP